MRVDFFRVEVSDGVDVDRILATIKALPQKRSERRTRLLSKVPFRMRVISKRQRFWDGDMTRIRMNDVPVRSSLDGRETNMALADDEGIGEHTAFRYDTRTRCLAIQTTRVGVSASKWAAYLEDISGEEGIVPVVVEEPGEGKETIRRLEDVRKIHIRYAGTIDAAVIANPLEGSVAGLDAISNTAPVAEVSVSVGNRKEGFNLQWAKTMLRNLYSQAKELATGGEQRIERIDVIGTFDDDAKANLNLLQFLMREESDVPVNRKTRRMMYADRKLGIADAWDKRQPQLDRMFRRRG